MTPAQRQQRQNIRNLLLIASVDQLKLERAEHYEIGDTFGVRVIDEMLAECKQYGVDNFGKTPAFP